MRLRKLTTTALLLLAGHAFAHAQFGNVWAFGGGQSGNAPNGSGVDFNDVTTPVAIGTGIDGMTGGAANASVSDHDGQLRFYTEGNNIWNKNGDIMPNGAEITQLFTLYPAMYNPTVNTSQGALIVAMPDSVDMYYVFSLSSAEKVMGPTHSGKLYYSVVDMSLNGGLGDVVPGRKGILIDSTLSEHMTAVAGNSCNVWVVVMPLISETAPGTASQFKAYEITESGLNLTPVISPPTAFFADKMSRGRLSFSPDRTKLAAGRQNLYPTPGSAFTGSFELYDFNPETGIVSNQIILDTTSTIFLTTGYNGVCFSPDNSKVYGHYNGLFDPSAIFQYDLSSNDANTIIASKTSITTQFNDSDIKAGPDGKLYFFHSGFTLAQAPNDSLLGVINFPNLVGDDTEVGVAPIAFLPGSGASNGLPNALGIPEMVDTTYHVEHIVTCSNEDVVSLEGEPTIAFWYQWDDSTTNTVRTVSEPGTYWVARSTYCHTWIDTFVVTKIILDPIITVDEFLLGTTIPYTTYQWLFNGNEIPGATGSTYTVTENGDYQVVVSNEDGCVDTSVVYEVTNATSISNPALYAKEINIYPNPANDILHINAPLNVDVTLTDITGKVIFEVQDAKQISVKDLASGLFLLQIRDKSGFLIKVEKVVKNSN